MTQTFVGPSQAVSSANQNRVGLAAGRIIENVSRVIVGKEEAVRLMLVALLNEGHVLLEDVPGVGKTMLARALSRSVGGSFKRIQFTPDLLPSDVTGVTYFNQKTAEFQFLPGPIMANLVLADEINRATPRTQACLLEAMQERQVTVESATRPLPRPFVVLATQNPIEQEGTFPLPEAQLDRFLLKVGLGYPSAEEEGTILTRFEDRNPLDDLAPVVSAPELLDLARLCRQVLVEDSIREYLVNLVRTTREHKAVRLGASPRASLMLYQAAQALAAVGGRGFVLPDDVKALAVPVLSHRLILASEDRLRGRTGAEIIREILDLVPAPVE